MTKLGAAEAQAIREAIKRNEAALRGIPGFIEARAGFPIRAGKVVPEPALIVYVENKLPPAELPAGGMVPATIDGIPTDTVAASVDMILRAKYGIELEPAALAANPTYVPPADGNINGTFEVTSKFVCHVGPDDGTTQLVRHLQLAKSTLTVGMYDFNADYLTNALVEHVKAHDVAVMLTLDDHMAAEEKQVQDRLKEQLPRNYTGWMVRCTYSTRFPTAYHIKVAVADSKHTWLSSGNWTRRSQPNIDPVNVAEDRKGMFSKGNREWHICLEDEAIAQEFEKYINYDALKSEEEDTPLAGEPPPPNWRNPPFVVVVEEEEAALAEPKVFAARRLPAADRTVKVLPILSPDNYVSRMRKLLQSAKKSLYIQMPYITWSDAPENEVFRELILLIAEKSQELEDVRIILGKSDAQVRIPMLVEQGMRAECIRTQSSLHNKGFIADGARVIVSSHNWSADGVLRNRDAGVIVHDAEVAGYYAKVFLWDWENRARDFIDAAALTVRVEPTRIDVAEGEHIMSLNEYLNP